MSHFLRRTTLTMAFTIAICSPFASYAQNRPSDAEVRAFADKLLNRMTLEEKIEQMEQAAGQYVTPERANELAKKGVGSFLFFTDPVRINELQKIAVTQSRLHIPLLFGYDVIHGFRTIFPVPLAMASSWDPGAVAKAQSMAALEARAAGIQWAFTPMVDIARDPRWGRIMEGAGEDPYLGEQMAAAQVHGLQGDYIGSPDHILACVKHFAGYGAAIGGRDYDSSDISDELLHNVYLRPYHSAVKAGVATVMSAYMDLNGVPASANPWLLQDVLRKDWGFKGFVVSDWETSKSLQTHGFAASLQDAAIRSVNAGVNMEMTSNLYRDYLPAATQAGTVTSATLDDLVRPILEMKYRLGLFTNPYIDVARAQQITLSTQEREASRQTAEKTAVLLRNQANILPLRKDIRSLAIIGPLADSQVDTLGSWSIHAERQDTITIAQGLREKLPNTKITVTKGVEIERPAPASIFDAQVPPTKAVMTTDEERKTEFDHALEAARTAEATVLVLGELQNMSGERASRATLTLPGRQEELLEAVTALGKPVVLVLMTGRPLDITWAASHVPAILNVWYPGTEGGHAVANLLTGDANPSGHLPLTWPREVGQIPLFYNTNLTQIPDDTAHRYWDTSSLPLYPFGFGLSYAGFEISDLALASAKVKSNSVIQASVKIKNTSAVTGEEVVQLYTHQRAGSASRPVRELKGFQKLALAPGETRTIQFSIPADELAFWSPLLRKTVLEPGAFDLWVGNDSSAKLHTSFEVISH
ncbi:beta-glucosidase BglX [Granulicella sp. dw_53]|uniref:beta-glucosidase BglX n=1 Tax=Granulicella sp. dw_53 TaxID=2719792 RepID=UPI002107767F|nr:beta-glucosidase BglX [Granulicella sp. dw_53]